MTNSSDALTSQQRYLPFGQVRTDVPQPSPITPTDFGYREASRSEAERTPANAMCMDWACWITAPACTILILTEQNLPVEFFPVPDFWSNTRAKKMYKFDLPKDSLVLDSKFYNDYVFEDLLKASLDEYSPSAKEKIQNGLRYVNRLYVGQLSQND